MIEHSREIIAKAIQNRWERYHVLLLECQQEFSADAVHDLRVASRRMLAALEVSRSVIPADHVRKLRRNIKDQIQELDDLRDTQVMLQHIARNSLQNPYLAVLVDRLERNEKKYLKAARRSIRTVRPRELNKLMQSMQTAFEEHAPESLLPQLVELVDGRYSAALHRYMKVKIENPYTVHRLRLSFKKFRYLVEFIHPMLEGIPQDLPSALRAYQTSMGNIQDMEVAMAHIRSYRIPRKELKEINEYFSNSHARALSDFQGMKSLFFEFWRITPGQKFPWENKT